MWCIRTYPDHEDSFPDVTDAVVDEARGVDELILLERLRGIGAQSLDGNLHLLSKPGHDCLKRKTDEEGH